MGLFDLFNKDKSSERKMKRLEKRITNMYLQAPERQYSFSELAGIGTDEAAWILMQRYNENNPNTTLDIEEKQLVFDTLTQMHYDTDADVIAQARRYVLAARDAHLEMKDFKITWPIKVLEKLLSPEEYLDFIVEVLAAEQTEYQRSVSIKQELMLRAADLKRDDLADQIARFVADDNETIRFLALDAAFAQDATERLSEAVFTQLMAEESNRVRQKAIDALPGRRDFVVPEAMRDEIAAWLPDHLNVHKEGFIYRRRR